MGLNPPGGGQGGRGEAAIAAGGDQFLQLSAHARVPELAQVVGRGGDRFVLRV